MLNEVSST